ncbi:MFS transporter [uncultured Megasphaera sp.]|uniref:MFS transporter n=1 Tax=uncultured Megasphaera sp. TaxID=165188 RepID=UPI0025E9E33A|nr:MFS transporter [uncultured Megasphaera sp.]
MDARISQLSDQAMLKAEKKLVPFIVLMYIFAFLDRANIGFAKQAFQVSTGISDAAFALGAGIFFIGYAFFEVPSNILMHKFGARLWLSRIMITWGLVSAGFALVNTEFQFLVLRVLLGIAEAGFMPAIVYYFTLWFTEKKRSTIMGLFWMGPPLAFILGSPISGMLLDLHGFLGFEGWQWMFAIEGILAAISGIFAFEFLIDSPEKAKWLSDDERTALQAALDEENSHRTFEKVGALSVLINPKVWYLAIICFMIQVVNYGLNFYLPTHVAGLLGAKVGTMVGFVSAIPWIFALIATVYLPRLSDKTGMRGSLAGIIIALSGIGYFVSSTSLPLLGIAALCIVAIGNLACQPIFWTMPSRILTGIGAASGIAFINSMGNLGGFVAPNLRVWAELIFNDPNAGLYALGISGFIATGLLLLSIPLKIGNNLKVKK